MLTLTPMTHLFIAGISIVFACVAHADQRRRPNVILILADDLGYRDLGYMGSDFYQTPNIDRLAQQSLRFNSAFSSHPTCSPSRAAIMTGKYPARLGIVSHGRPGTVVSGDSTFMKPEEYTLAEALRDAGYTTCHVGKWHVGSEGYSGPKEQGFEYDIASNEFCCPGSFFYPYRDKNKPGKKGDKSAVPDLEDRGSVDHLTECLGDEAATFITDHADDEKPFFLNLWYYAVHTPIQAENDKVEKYKQLRREDAHQKNPNYAGLVEHLDDSVGHVLAAIKQAGIEEDTVVFFCSDNGGEVRNAVTSNYPLRNGKVTQYLGGVRVPMLVRWPGVTAAGVQCDEPVIGHDVYPTLLSMLNIKGQAEQNAAMDGRDISSLLRDPTATISREYLCWLRYPVVFHYRKGARALGPVGSIVKGDWKLMEFFATPHGVDADYELYNLREDLSEKYNLADKFPKKVAELKADMQMWREDVSAPDYDSAYREYAKIE